VAEDNPWSDEGWSRTKQGQYLREHGRARAEARARDAGTKLGGGRPKAASPGGAGEKKKQYVLLTKRILVPDMKITFINRFSDFNLGIEQSVSLDLEAQAAASILLGIEQSVSLDLEAQAAASILLGIEQSVSLDLEPFLRVDNTGNYRVDSSGNRRRVIPS